MGAGRSRGTAAGGRPASTVALAGWIVAGILLFSAPGSEAQIGVVATDTGSCATTVLGEGHYDYYVFGDSSSLWTFLVATRCGPGPAQAGVQIFSGRRPHRSLWTCYEALAPGGPWDRFCLSDDLDWGVVERRYRICAGSHCTPTRRLLAVESLLLS